MTLLESKTKFAVEDLAERVQGQVLAPGDAGYDEARLAWNRAVDQQPAVIVAALRTEDVVEAVCFAHKQGLGVAVQSTGHGVIRNTDGAVLVVTSRMKELYLDVEAQTARLGAGLEWGEVLAVTQKYGLAPLLGSSPNVGVVGYTLGGGLGWLGRKYGLAADSVLSFEVVSAAGDILRADPVQNTELFWALRGGGGSFGIVTSMEIKLYPVKTVYGGNLLYPGEMAREVMQRYREWIANAPEELTSSIVLMNYPALPQVPEFLRGKSFVMVRGVYSGRVLEGEKLLDYWRKWVSPAVDDFRVMPFSEVARVSNDPLNPMPSFGTGAWMRELSDEAIDTLIRYAAREGGLSVVEVRHAGGAVARGGPHPAAFGHRDAPLVLFAVGTTPTPEAFERLRSYTEKMKEDLCAALTGGVYMNFLSGEEARERTRQGYSPATFRGLQEVKAKYDPENLFHYGYDLA